MIYLFGIYIILVFYKMKFHREVYDDYMSKEKTTSIKGVFIIMVFFSHFNSYIQLASRFDNIYYSIFCLIGQAMVAMFMFYSGFGIMESIDKKGIEYILSLPQKRVLPTLLRFDIAVLLFLILDWIIGIEIDVKTIILSFVGWESIGNSNWYIFIILLLYTITYITFRITKKWSIFGSIVFNMILVMMIIVFFRYYDLKPIYWYDTMLCYVFGMFYQRVHIKVEKIFKQSIYIWGIVLFSSIGIFVLLRSYGFFCNMVANLVFCITMIVFSLHISLDNRIINKCGNYLFEIYILQRIPMIIFRQLGVSEINIYIYFVICILFTGIIAYAFRSTLRKFMKK